ncbi:MAG TPA: serine/threonine-protein kinase, partial [Planctomycetia bacterium]|nr:serine/threonine-protein kinase [Planctomycetia bacterium]
MSGDGTSDGAGLSTEALRRLVALCDRLESSWRPDARPDFQELTAFLPLEERGNALRELLAIDVERRRQVGQVVAESDYAELFGNHLDAVREALDAATSHSGLPPPPPVVPGHELLERIGSGGMGTVFRARHLATDRLVAVKLVRADLLHRLEPDARDTLTRRFAAEARAAAALDHPGIVPIYDAGEIDGWRYITMRLMEGGSLADLVRRGTTPAEAAGLAVRIATALQHAHDRRVLHRDLKPANILLDAAGAPLIADFGLAKRSLSDSGEYSRSAPGVGTPGYMSLEQAAGAELTPRSDIYSLGATLFELLTGRPPASLAAEKEQEAGLAGVPAGLRAICLQCLRTNPEERYASSAALAAE